MKFLFFAAIFSFAACVDNPIDTKATNNQTNNSSNNKTITKTSSSNNMTSPNNKTASNNSTVSNNAISNNGTTANTTQMGSETFTFSATATDFASTQLFEVEVLTGEAYSENISERAIASGDIGLSMGKNFYFILDRGVFGVHEGSIEVYDLNGEFEAKIELDGNVKDAVDVGEKIFVTRYQDGKVQVIKKEGEEWKLASSIDLTPFNKGAATDGDLDPEVDAIVANGNDLIVVLQTLNGFDPVEKSQVVIIDAQTELVVDQVEGGEVNALQLLNRNAFSGLVKVADDIIAVGSIGDFGSASVDAGIELLTKGADGRYTTTAYLTEEVFGVDLFSFLFIDDDKGFAITGFDKNFVAFEKGLPLEQLPGDMLSNGVTAMSQMEDYLIVSFVNTEGAGFNIYEKNTGSLLASIPIDLGEGTTLSDVILKKAVVNN